MTEPYTPSMDQLRNAYAAHVSYCQRVSTDGLNEFDRAIRKVQAEAWDECHTATCPDLGDWRHACVNPYEEGATDE